ncbi:RraA family protein [Bacillus sp. JJ1562]|uniref:RraA family protein n=1 Tax=Bacillus sp. JJ1562 TaxID=3122960 RepID=UPI0030036311
MEEILTEFQYLPTTCISDAMNELGNIHSSIKPLNDNYHLVGRAFTVKMPVGDNYMVLKGIKEAKPGDVLVVDAKGDTHRAIAGDFVVGMAKTLGLGGIVVDGVIRDINGIKKLNFPVFCKGTTVAASGKFGEGQLNVPISCGGASIHPGDIIVGDADGVVVIPKNIEKDVVQKSKEKLEKDIRRANKTLGNSTLVKTYIDNILT